MFGFSSKQIWPFNYNAKQALKIPGNSLQDNYVDKNIKIRRKHTTTNSQELSWRNLCAMEWLACESSSGFKISTTSPFTRRQTTSAILWICLILWETITIVIPWFFFSFTIASSIFCVDIGSKALVGSSSSKTFTRRDVIRSTTHNSNRKFTSIIKRNA